jgi:hypothetical protein
MEGNITNDGTRKFLKSFMEAFAAWIEVFLARWTPRHHRENASDLLMRR